MEIKFFKPSIILGRSGPAADGPGAGASLKPERNTGGVPMKFFAGLDLSGLMIAGNAQARSFDIAGTWDHCRIPGRR
jgi:hypothetical protein